MNEKPTSLNRFCLLVILLSLTMISACGDPDDDTQTILVPVAGTSAGAEMTGGTEMAGATAGTEMAGSAAGVETAGSIAGAEMAGAVAGTEMAGMSAGTEIAGMTAGTEMAGSAAGTEMAGMIAGAEMAGMSAGAEMAGTPMVEGDPCDQRQPDPTLPCVATIYEVRNPMRIAPGRMVTVEGVISAIREGDEGVSHLVMQISSSSPDYIDPAYSASWVYLNDAAIDLPLLSIGQSIEITAEIGDYFGQRQLQSITALVDLGSLYPLIVPIAVEAGTVATGGAIAEAYEGVLVSISPVEVIEQNPLAGPGDRDPTNEFVINGGLRVNDFLTTLSPLPEIGESWSQIIGVMRLGNGDHKIEPRNLADVGRPIPMGDASMLRINEVDYSQPGADNGEFIEVINLGDQPAPLWGVYLDLINGTNFGAYSSYHLAEAADTLAPGEMLVVGSVSITMNLSDVPSLILNSAIQNGPDGIRLSQDTLGILDDLGYGDLSLGEGTSSVVDADMDDQPTSIGRCSMDSDNNSVDFVVMQSTPGASNQCL